LKIAILIYFAVPVADLSKGAFIIVIISIVISFHRPPGFSADPSAFTQFSKAFNTPWPFAK
jgi:hypothetical protein